MKISVIIPTYNEEENIGHLLQHLKQIQGTNLVEILVVDGGSQDQTVREAKKYDVKVLKSPKKGRASQMNYGVKQSKGEILQFIHADTMPPDCNFSEIKEAVKSGFPVGCFTYRFDSWHPLLVINGFFTRFDRLWCRGGDQGIFCTREVFETVGGYRDDFMIMEEYDFLEKVQPQFPFRIIKKNYKVSARKYKENNYMAVQKANFKVFKMYKQGASQQEMVNTYKSLLQLKS